MIEQQQATTIAIVFQEKSFKWELDQVKKFIRKDFSAFRVGGVAQDGYILSFWVEHDPDPLMVYAHLLGELSRRFAWILQRQLRIINNAIEIFLSNDSSMRVRLVSKFDFDPRVAAIS